MPQHYLTTLEVLNNHRYDTLSVRYEPPKTLLKWGGSIDNIRSLVAAIFVLSLQPQCYRLKQN